VLGLRAVDLVPVALASAVAHKHVAPARSAPCDHLLRLLRSVAKSAGRPRADKALRPVVQWADVAPTWAPSSRTAAEQLPRLEDEEEEQELAVGVV